MQNAVFLRSVVTRTAQETNKKKLQHLTNAQCNIQESHQTARDHRKSDENVTLAT